MKNKDYCMKQKSHGLLVPKKNTRIKLIKLIWLVVIKLMNIEKALETSLRYLKYE